MKECGSSGEDSVSHSSIRGTNRDPQAVAMVSCDDHRGRGGL